jgi:hypothetical protein
VAEQFEDVDNYEAKVTFEKKELNIHKTADSLIKFLGLDGDIAKNLNCNCWFMRLDNSPPKPTVCKGARILWRGYGGCNR